MLDHCNGNNMGGDYASSQRAPKRKKGGNDTNITAPGGVLGSEVSYTHGMRADIPSPRAELPPLLTAG